MSATTEIYGKSFAGEALDRFPNKIVTNVEQIDAWVAKGATSGQIVNNLARIGNPVWQQGRKMIRPPLIYGTVDGAGNVSELLMMTAAAGKLQVPMVLLLDDNAYCVANTYDRLTRPSLELLGLGPSDFDLSEGGLKYHKVSANRVLPVQVIRILNETGVDTANLSLAEVYRQCLYLVAAEIYGEEVLDQISIVPVTQALSLSPVGQLPMSELKNRVLQIGRETGRLEMVFVHTRDCQKVGSLTPMDRDETVGSFYSQGGWLGGTAWVTLTALLTDPTVFPGAGAAIMGEKDTTLGQNFAMVYETLGRDLPEEAMKIAITAVRRIKASTAQSGGDGVDPVLMYCLLKTAKQAELIKGMIREQIGTAFPMKSGFDKEQQVVLMDTKTQLSYGAKLLKEEFGIDGNYLMNQGLKGPKIGQTIRTLTEIYIEGQLSPDRIREIINLSL